VTAENAQELRLIEQFQQVVGRRRGGAVAGNKIGYLNQVRFLRSYGFDEKKKYLSQCVGTNANMDTLQAVVLNEMLPGLNDLNKSRAAAAGTYTQRMSDLGLFQYLTVQNTSNLEGPHYRDHVYHLFVIRLNDPSKRDRLLDYLRSKDIGCAVHYQLPIHQQPAYSRLDRVRLPNVESLAASMISLPLFPYITREEIYYVCETIREFFSNA
jgi:dTDP-4-amino-4,6-dideoxygalactose transaminase